jgi:hypothetical protein
MFVHMIVDDRGNIRDVETSMKFMIGNVTGRVGYDTEKFGLVCMHNSGIRFVGESPQINSIGPYRSETIL